MAFFTTVASSTSGRGGRGLLRPFLHGIALVCTMTYTLAAAPASAQKADISGLTDLTFTLVSFTSPSTTMSEDICVYSSSFPERYQVTASGSGSGGSFILASGSDTLAYQVAWSSSPGQTSGGTLLSAGVPLTGQTSGASQKTCNSGPATSASLIITIPYSAVDAATAGNYNGMLNLTVIPE